MNPSAPAESLLAEIHVSANCSLTRRGAMVFFGVVAASCFTVAGFFVWHGYWPVLPFAGLELFVLGVVLGYSMRQGRHREVISVYADRVIIEQGDQGSEEVTSFPRHWAHTRMIAPHGRSRRSRLYVCSHGQRREIGVMLNESARAALGQRLAGLIGALGNAPDSIQPAGQAELHQNEVSWD